MKLPFIAICLAAIATAFAAVEEPIDSRYKPAVQDAATGDWQGIGGRRIVAQVILDEHGDYQANLLSVFDAENNVVGILHGQNRDGRITLKGGGWSGVIADGHFTGVRDAESFDMHHVLRIPPMLGAKAPAGAVVLFDGSNLDAWAKKKGKQWLVEDGPAPWKITPEGWLEVVPGTGGGIITRRQFGDCHLHVEFRTLGAPSNSGLFLQARYEANINETYGRLDGTPNGGFDNCTDKIVPRLRASRPPLEWQTFDIDFSAPRFDAHGKKTASATATVLLNGVEIYDRQVLDPPHGAAGRLGEAPTGPLMLQEHGMPLQFRNIWLVESPPPARPASESR